MGAISCSKTDEPVAPAIEEIVPPKALAEMKPYITIYEGNTPPNIEGAYFLDPLETVFCQDYSEGHGFEPGKIVASQYIKFYNQNNATRTLEYMEKDRVDGAKNNAVGSGAFITGNNNNFTVYMNTEGTMKEIATKMAVVISGTKTSSGISNLQYAFVMVEKGDDPENELMKVGFFRVFKDKDGLASAVDWPTDSKSSGSLNKRDSMVDAVAQR
ncbi:MAG: hypothetical protein ACK5M3_00440 [Dysgonomonas sp.]